MVAEEAKLERLRRKMADYEKAIQRGQLTGSDDDNFGFAARASEQLSDSSGLSHHGVGLGVCTRDFDPIGARDGSQKHALFIDFNTLRHHLARMHDRAQLIGTSLCHSLHHIHALHICHSRTHPYH